MSNTEITKYCRKKAERQRNYQKLKDLRLHLTPVSATEFPSSSMSYHSNQSFGKAVKTTKIVLPFSPQKRKAVVSALTSIVINNPYHRNTRGYVLRDTSPIIGGWDKYLSKICLVKHTCS